jgi:hypothetical protein
MFHQKKKSKNVHVLYSYYRFFSKPSNEDDDDYTLSDAVDVKPSSYTPSGVPVYVSSSAYSNDNADQTKYPSSVSYESKRYKPDHELPAYAKPQPIPVATVFSPSHIKTKVQSIQPLPLEEQPRPYVAEEYKPYKEPEYSYGSTHEPAYAPHDEPAVAVKASITCT